MAFWNRKKKVEMVKVRCKCGGSHELDCEGLGTAATGYKGRLSFYTRCENCDEIVYVDEMQLPKRYVKSVYKRYFWG